MFELFTKPAAPSSRPAAPRVVPGPHRQRFTVEVVVYRSPADADDCLATPTGGRRVVLYGGRGPLPTALAATPDRVVRLAGRTRCGRRRSPTPACPTATPSPCSCRTTGPARRRTPCSTTPAAGSPPRTAARTTFTSADPNPLQHPTRTATMP